MKRLVLLAVLLTGTLALAQANLENGTLVQGKGGAAIGTLSGDPTQCDSGNAPTGITKTGAAKGCQSVGGGSAPGIGDTLPLSPAHKDQYHFIDNSTVGNSYLTCDYTFNVDAWQCPLFSSPLAAALNLTSKTLTDPVWYAYSRVAPNFDTATLTDLHLAHLPGVTGIPGITSGTPPTISGSVELNDLPDLTGTVTLTAPKFTIHDIPALTGLTLAFTGGNGDLVLTGAMANNMYAIIDATSSTITTFNFSTAVPVDCSNGPRMELDNATLLTTVTPPPPNSTWGYLIFTGDALSQATVDALIASTIAPGAGSSCFANGSGIVEFDGGTSAAPSVTGLLGLGTLLGYGGGLNANPGWNHVADFAITAVDQGTKTFTIAGNQSANARFGAGTVIEVTGSNSGDYTVVSATFDTDHTNIVVSQAIRSATADGTIGN